MTERQSSEVEKVLLHVDDARSRARRAAEACAADGAEDHIAWQLYATPSVSSLMLIERLHRAPITPFPTTP